MRGIDVSMVIPTWDRRPSSPAPSGSPCPRSAWEVEVVVVDDGAPQPVEPVLRARFVTAVRVVDLRVINGVRPEPTESLIAQLPVRNSFPGGPSNVVVLRSLLDRVGPFEATMRVQED